MPSRHHRLLVGTFIIVAALAVFGLAACGASTKTTGASPHPSSDPAGYAWAVGDRGVIMATTDGGAHWVKQKSGTTRILSGVAFADAKHGWAVGGMNNGETDTRTQLVLSTSDGGTHWAGETLGRRGGYLLAVACSDPSHVWVGGTYGNGTGAEILASTDGGVTWTTQYRDHLADDLISAIVFADASHGWALTEYGQVLATSDGGAHWAAQRIPGPRPLMWVQLACSDADHCWIAGLGAKNPSTLAGHRRRGRDLANRRDSQGVVGYSGRLGSRYRSSCSGRCEPVRERHFHQHGQRRELARQLRRDAGRYHGFCRARVGDPVGRRRPHDCCEHRRRISVDDPGEVSVAVVGVRVQRRRLPARQSVIRHARRAVFASRPGQRLGTTSANRVRILTAIPRSELGAADWPRCQIAASYIRAVSGLASGAV